MKREKIMTEEQKPYIYWLRKKKVSFTDIVDRLAISKNIFL